MSSVHTCWCGHPASYHGHGVARCTAGKQKYVHGRLWQSAPCECATFDPIDTSNAHLVTLAGTMTGAPNSPTAGLVVIQAPRAFLTKREALLLAAWLVRFGELDGDRFEHALDAVKST